MWVTIFVTAFWCGVVFGGKYLYRSWRRWYYLQPARSLSEIASTDYYRQLSNTQFESLVLRTLKERGYTFLGDPWLGRTKDQGYAWRKGKKILVSYRLTRPLKPEQLLEISKKMHGVKADSVLLLTPLPGFPEIAPSGVKILGGKKLVRWFSVLDIVPPVATRSVEELCECGAVLKERVSRAGQPLLVCSMYPDCRVMRQPTETVALPHLPLRSRPALTPYSHNRAS